MPMRSHTDTASLKRA
ncbi:hypothetical protein Taro_056799 [Colocasia esculenta]|uniref:Uncharacterized protein n=1 Tax=Colocasia esculenta TaxID=4460 RepID=A0A843XXI5_COLES|nr:hypothetical protein [Colocasia esculenta]